ncbi:hypothetical protein ACFSQE_05515 [Vogesella fluminis]|uniref:hypothetical protein n=1 Tax=Vogesella fluminis TaxID=1069161 RepID=UPI0036438375
MPPVQAGKRLATQALHPTLAAMHDPHLPQAKKGYGPPPYPKHTHQKEKHCLPDSPDHPWPIPGLLAVNKDESSKWYCCTNAINTVSIIIGDNNALISIKCDTTMPSIAWEKQK